MKTIIFSIFSRQNKRDEFKIRCPHSAVKKREGLSSLPLYRKAKSEK